MLALGAAAAPRAAAAAAAAPAAAAALPSLAWPVPRPHRRCPHTQQQQQQQQRRHPRRRAPQPATALPPEAAALLQQAGAAHPGWAAGAAVNALVFAAGAPVLRKGLTLAGMAHAWLLGTAVFAAFGAGGFALVCLYFLFGTAVTRVKLEQKQKEGIAEARSGRRGPSSVWGSGSAGAVCAMLALATGDFSLWQIGFVASFTSKLSDTVSSEIGKAYGRTTYLITTLQRVPRGTEGAVSLEGTLAGLAAAGVYAAAALALGQASAAGVGVITGAAFVANVAESYIGAVAQGRLDWLSNDAVNVIQICLAAAAAVAAARALPGAGVLA